MKKTFTLLLTVISAAALLSACGKSEETLHAEAAASAASQPLAVASQAEAAASAAAISFKTLEDALVGDTE